MEFRSNRLTNLMIGLIAAFIGVFNLFMFLTFSDRGAPAFLGVLGIILLLISSVAFTYRSSVRIDKRRMLIEKTLGALFWGRTRHFQIHDFQKVGITMGSRTNAGGPTTIYFVQLLGLHNLSIPGSSSDFAAILSKARKISQFIDLPVDDSPRMGFFGSRL